MITNIKANQAFTLAEVLITLGIIGVVAALTIPNLVISYQKQETVTRLKKAYSVILQSNLSAVSEKGSMESWFTPDITDGTAIGANLFAETYLIPYLNISKNCGLTNDASCTESIKSLDPSFGIVTNVNATQERFFLNDGTFIVILPYDSTNNRFHVYVDINGTAGPNIFGKDVFYFFYYSNGRFVPECANGPRTTCMSSVSGWGCTKNGGRGTFCSGLIVQDGWQIKDDYPW